MSEPGNSDLEDNAPHDNAVAGVSGGETSAEMAKRLKEKVKRLQLKPVLFSFQNTSREHRKTYEFIDRLEQWLEEPIVRLEHRAPPRGEPPKNATFEVVKHSEMCTNGDVYRDVMEMCRSFRDKHNKLNPVDGCGCRNCKNGNPGPIAPWARSRFCTAYMKVRTQRRYCESLGWGPPTEYTEYVGLRADEPKRIAKMRLRNEQRDTDERAPLADVGVTKRDVLAAWAARPFRLQLSPHDGNCTKCFLKDEADIATSMMDEEKVDPTMSDSLWWIDAEETYGPMRRGGRPSFRQILEEMPARRELRAALRRGDVLVPLTNLQPRRRKLIIAQELEWIKNGPAPFSCECDAAKDNDDDLDLLLEVA